MKDTYVYFAANSDAIKIGYSAQPEVRWQYLRPRLRRLWMIGVMPGERCDEVAFHARFKHLRIDLYEGEREWFRPAPELIQFIDLLEAHDWLTPWDEYLEEIKHKPEAIIVKQSSADFPRDAAAFKTWADATCAAWPESLTERAYSAHQAMLGHRGFPVGLIDFFDAAYADYRAANKGA